MKFSVLIAHYNNAKYFKDCYDSLLSQSYQNWEAIILDDASKDEEKKAVLEIISADSRFKYFENEKNCGVGLTKAKLIELATGEICGFVDPDDALFPNAIEDSILAIQSNKRIICTYSHLTLCDAFLTKTKIHKGIKQIYNDRYFFNSPMQLSHFFTFKRDAYFNTNGIDTQLKSAVDQDLYLKLLEQGDAKFINKEMYRYRLHSEGVSQEKSKSSAKNNFALVIFNAMKRRDLKEINGQKIPEKFTNSKEIFKLLDYQNSTAFRIKKKLNIIFQSFS